MKKTLITAMTLILCFSAQAQSSYTKALKGKSSTKSTRTSKANIATESNEEKTLIFQGGLLAGDLGSTEEGVTETIDLNGVAVDFGRLYNFTPLIEGTTSLGLRSLSADIENLDDDARGWDLLDISIKQKISLIAEASDFLRIKPFIAGGIGRGLQTITLQINDTDAVGQLDLVDGYTRVNYGAGIDFEFSNGVTPFVQYQISRLNLDNEPKLEGTVNGVNINEDIPQGELELADLETKVLMIGVGYRF